MPRTIPCPMRHARWPLVTPDDGLFILVDEEDLGLHLKRIRWAYAKQSKKTGYLVRCDPATDDQGRRGVLVKASAVPDARDVEVAQSIRITDSIYDWESIPPGETRSFLVDRRRGAAVQRAVLQFSQWADYPVTVSFQAGPDGRMWVLAMRSGSKTARAQFPLDGSQAMLREHLATIEGEPDDA